MATTTTRARTGTGTEVIGTEGMGRGGTLALEPVTLARTLGDGSLDETHAAPVPASGVTSLGASRSTTVLPRLELAGGKAELVRSDRPRYERQGLLGEGGVGEVLRTRDNDIDRIVAVKRLRTTMRAPGHLVRFVDEIRTIGSLEHPNIVPIHDVGVDEEGQYFFVMKYVDGETLETILEKLAAGDPLYHARFGIERRVEIFLAVLEAIAYAHARGIIHRDIKPANIMVGQHGEVTVMDWGLARKMQTGRGELAGTDDEVGTHGTDALRTRVGSLLGTPAYMSPEQARGEVLDERSDIYALCVMFAEMLSLEHYLAHEKTLEGVLAGVQTKGVPSPSLKKSPHQPSASMDLSHFVRHGVAKDRSQRYRSVDEMIDRLRRRAEGEIPIECHITLVKRGSNMWARFVDRHPFIVSTMMLVGIVGMVLGTVSSLRH